MGLPEEDLLALGQLQPQLLVMWGSAAGAQSQSTPGVSALAAPRTKTRLLQCLTAGTWNFFSKGGSSR
jgi:hypothetical protein